MKIIYKTYVLLAIVITVSSINLFLLLSTAQENEAILHSVSSASDLKVTVERIAGIANSIASGNEYDRQTLVQQIGKFDNDYGALGNGGTINGTTVAAVPAELQNIYGDVGNSWNLYKQQAQKIQQEPVFNLDVKNSLKYVLEKNGDLIILTNNVENDLSSLDRNYNRHKVIAAELVNLTKSIGQNTLLISIGEEQNSRENIKNDRILFNADIRKLEGLPLDNLQINGTQIKPETLQPIPRVNSASLRDLDPLWESIDAKLQVIESNSLLSKEFGGTLKNLNGQRGNLLSLATQFVDAWNTLIDKKLSERVAIVQGLIVGDIAVFAIIIFSIRRSLNPLEILSKALSRVKEGFYGELIDYHSKDEIGTLAETFNSMSTTIQQKEEEAKKIDTAKDEFLAMITHELKTPLVPIQGYADILLAGHLGQLNKNQKERMEIIKSSSASLLSLISDLLDAQKLELGQLRITKKTENIKSTIDQTIKTMLPQAMTDQIELKSNLQNDIYASYDVTRIAQVLNNLVKNSLKAVLAKTGKVEIVVEDSPEEVRISVKDNGKGIKKEVQNKIFTKFYQIDTSTTREKGGSGLGLSISKGIVEAHGGKIWFSSEPGIGSTFTFTIPKTKT